MRIFFIFFFSFLSFFALGQIKDYTTEKTTLSHTNAQVGDEVEVVFEVQIAKDWYIYSSEFKAEGPNRAEFIFTPHASYQLIGGILAINPKRKYDKDFDGEVAYFEKKAEFRQKIKLLTTKLNIAGDYSFQTCSTITGQCLLPETVPFTFDQTAIKITGKAIEDKKATPKEAKEEQKNNDKKDTEENPKEEAKTDTSKNSAENGQASLKTPDKQDIKKQPITPNPAPSNQNESLLGFMLLAFLGGFSAIFTPCVFPMIPMTVTFFTKNKKKEDTSKMTEAEIKAVNAKHRRKALREVGIFALSIIGIYTLLGVFFSAVFGAGFNNWLSTHWIPNLFFFFLLIFFGLSFLGMYEIVLPASWVNAADKQADKGGYWGIMFMAFTLAMVSFSCTAPIVGSLLVAASGGALIKPILGMIAFSTAVALPFALFAAFPSWLNSLPKSGGWLNAVKVTLGFIELAFSLKFFSQADLVYHWGILNRDIFITFWIVIFSFLGFYLLGKMRLPHDSPTDKIGVTRLMFALFSFSFVVYLVPGLFGAPLRPLAGYLPPESTMEWSLGAGQASSINTSPTTPRKHSKFLKLPHKLDGFFDLKEALAYAKQVGKPIFIDFTGHGCVNCREMEASVWSKPEVLARLREDYVMLALYVDDRKVLPEADWYVSKRDKKTKKSIGDQSADYQMTKYDTNSQPYYCIINAEEESLLTPIAYSSVADFTTFLEAGKQAFQRKNK